MGALNYTYQWQSCGPDGGSCEEIAGATGASYTPDTVDVGSTLQVEVTAATDVSSATETRAPTSPITAGSPPASLTAPSVSGDPTDGQTLTADVGTWSGNGTLVYGYQWQECAADGSDCTTIDSATNQTYTLEDRDVGHTLSVQVTASDLAGAATVSSPTTPIVQPVPAPVNTALPTLTALGPTAVPTTMVTDGGGWTNVPASRLLYQWRRCDATGANCRDIARAKTSSYELSAADVGARVQVRVLAVNSSGQVSGTSRLSAVVSGSTETAIGKIVYLSADRTAIYVANDDGSSQQKIADCTAAALASSATRCGFYQPEIAPDATMLAVQEHAVDTYGNQSGVNHIILMQIDGSDAHVLTDGSQPAWTPDGAQIAYTGSDSVYQIHPDGHDANSPTPVVPGGRAGHFSPDGQYVAYSAPDPSTGKSGIYFRASIGRTTDEADTSARHR